MSLPLLYSFRRCPYAMRGRLGLAAAGITVELREILLRDKPADMLKCSPKGTVPVLALPGGQVIDESGDVMLWALEQNDPDNWLSQRGASLSLVSENDEDFKPWLDRYKYFERHPEQPRRYYREQALQILTGWESRLRENDGHLIARAPRLADYALMPFVRQFARSDLSTWNDLPLPLLRAWLTRLENSDLFAVVMRKYPVWNQQSAGATVHWR